MSYALRTAAAADRSSRSTERSRASRPCGSCRSPSSGTPRRPARSAGSCSAPAGPRRTRARASAVSGSAPSRSLTQAHSSSPYFTSGTPMTCASSDVRVGVEELLDLARVDVLAAADDHVLDPAGDVDVAVAVHHPEVAGVHPAGPVDRLGGLLRLVPVAEHHRVAAGAQLAGLAAGQRQPGLRVDDLDLDVRVHPADRGHAAGRASRRPGSGWTPARSRSCRSRSSPRSCPSGSTTCFITSTGHGEPAMIPVRSERRS